MASVLAQPEGHSGGGFLVSEITGPLLGGKLRVCVPLESNCQGSRQYRIVLNCKTCSSISRGNVCSLGGPFTAVLVHGAWQRSAVHQSFSTQRAWMLVVRKRRGDAFHACGGVQKYFPWNSRAWKVIRDDHK